MALGFIFYGLLVAITFWRLSLWQANAGVSWWDMEALAVVSLVMTVQGYLGGELVYRYGVEVEQAYRELPERDAKSQPPPLASSTPRAATAHAEKGKGAA